jgi:hypothetical protein
VIIEDSRTGEVECWVEVPGHEGRYMVSSFGRVRSLDRVVIHKNGRRRMHRGKELKTFVDENGRPMVTFSPSRLSTKVALAVAAAFLGARPPGLQICHWNDTKTDNHLANLRYDTASANQADAVRNGRRRVVSTDRRLVHRRALERLNADKINARRRERRRERREARINP